VIRTHQDVLRPLAAYTGADARLIAGIETLLSEPPDRQARILDLTMRLANSIPNMGVILAFETVIALAHTLIKEERSQ
jgi:hypothetical protein